MAIAGLVLLVAAVLKTHQLLTEPTISKSFWESWLFFVIQIPLETGLGIWLLTGLFRKTAWLLGLFAFTVFISVTAYKGMIGIESCGCFGKVEVNPWITLATIDLPLLFAMLVFRPKDCKFLPPPWPSARHFFSVFVLTVVILAALTLTLVFNRPADVTDKHVVVRAGDWVKRPSQTVFDPEPNKPPRQTQAADQNEPAPDPGIQQWEMFQYIDIADSLRSGLMILFFYRHDCPTCHEAIPLYDQMARDLQLNSEAIQIAFIEIPPYGSDEDNSIPEDTPALKGRLDDSKQWYNLTTPVITVLLEAQVVKVWQGQAPDLNTILEAIAQTD